MINFKYLPMKPKNNPDIKKQNRILREWIKFVLSLKGFTLKGLAEKNGVTAGCLGTVFYHPYPKMERIIATALKKRPWDFWPERYDEKGNPNRPNLWYRRKYGLWHSKNITPREKINAKKNKLNYSSKKEGSRDENG
jgi:Ner family transcriptional regulator